MGKSQEAPPPPDYSGVAAANEQSAKYSFQLGKDQLDFFKKQYKDNKAVSDEVIDFAMGVMDRNDYNAQQDRERYETIFQPLEEQLAKDAEDYSQPWRQEQEAGKAEADVAQQFEQARTTAQAQLESYGIDPSQTRAGAMDLQSRVAEAAAQASAGNQARTMVEDRGRALRSEAINVGKGYPGSIAQTYGTASNAGNQGVNSGLATTQSAATTMGTPTQYQGLGNQAVQNWGNTLNMGYQNQMDAFKANQAADSSGSGIGSALGLVGSLATMFAEGGAIPENMPPGAAAPVVAPPAAGEGVIPAEASPSRGAIQDDVPVSIEGGGKGRLNVGEFVIPEDVVRWKGEEFFQKFVGKEREKKTTNPGPAQPQAGVVPESDQELRNDVNNSRQGFDTIPDQHGGGVTMIRRDDPNYQAMRARNVDLPDPQFKEASARGAAHMARQIGQRR
jgi:hypothetical protein